MPAIMAVHVRPRGVQTSVNPLPRREHWFSVGLVLAYAAAAICLTYPGILAYTHAALGLPGDLFQNLWNIMWVGGWLAGHHALYFTALEYYPTGANLAWETLSLPVTIVAALLRPLIGLAAAYNTVLLLSLVADGLAIYGFARTIGLSLFGASVAGLAFMSSPYFVGQLLGHVNMVGAFCVPWFLTVLWRVYQRPRSPLWRYFGLAGTLGLTTYVVQDYALYAIAAGFLLMWLHPGRPWRTVWAEWWRWAVAIVAYVALVAPQVYAMVYGPLAVHGAAAQPVTTPWVVDLEGLVLPQPWGLFAGLANYWRLAPDLLDGGIFPGFALWAAAIALAWKRRQLPSEHRAIVGWAAVGTGLFAILSLGPVLHVGGHVTSIPLPDRVLAALPLWQDTWPERLAMMTALFGAILVGVAAEWLRTRLDGEAASRPRGRFIVLTSALFLIAAASWTVGFPATPIPSVPYASAVRHAGGTVLYVPAVMPGTLMTYGPFNYIYVEGVLGVPTPEGYVSRIPARTRNQLDRSPVLHYLWGVQFSRNPAAQYESAAATQFPGYLRRHHVHSIIFLTGSGVAHPDRTVSWLRQHLGTAWQMRKYNENIVFLRR